MKKGSQQRIAIIGGGAKAAAIAAKVACLRDVADLPIEVVIFERDQLASGWTGRRGFTDGAQQLCTPAERDVGFPYSSETFGSEVAAMMQSHFSWSAFAVATNRYAHWVDRGRLRPTHALFAEYLSFCVIKSEAKVTIGEVIGLVPGRACWNVTFAEPATGKQHTDGPFNGVVVTGTGPASQNLPSVRDPRVLNGETFWKSLRQIASLTKPSNAPIVIMGSGGTAAAVAAWLVKAGIDRKILILGTQVALFTRAENSFENAAFRDQDLWKSLSVQDRVAFTDRLTRGAVWSSVLDILSRGDNVTYLPGRAKTVRYEPPGTVGGEIFVEFSASGAPKDVQFQAAGLVVDATGFNAWWFVDLLPSPLKARLLGGRGRMQAKMTENLALQLLLRAPLHAPMLSQAVGPAYSSLMALGAMSDAILGSYVDASL